MRRNRIDMISYSVFVIIVSPGYNFFTLFKISLYKLIYVSCDSNILNCDSKGFKQGYILVFYSPLHLSYYNFSKLMDLLPLKSPLLNRRKKLSRFNLRLLY